MDEKSDEAEAIALWQEKLEFFYSEQEKAVDPDVKFSILKRIEEAEQELASLGAPVRMEKSQLPSYADDRTRELSRSLRDAFLRMAELRAGGEDYAEVQEEIFDIQRRLRAGHLLRPGDFLLDGRFRLLEIVGRGGFANVWRAFDFEARRHVAAKVLHGQYRKDSSRLERFFRGARKMASLLHRGVVQVYDYQLEGYEYPFYTMEYLPRGDFGEAVKSGELSKDEIITIILQTGEALHFAHENGFIHRDVKPSNILLTAEGTPKLTDFDLVRAFDTTGGTQTGGMLGTIVYASPELMGNPQNAGVEADVYGLGMTTIFAFYGQDLPLEIIRMAPDFIDSLDTSPKIRKVLKKAIQWNISGRHETVDLFIDEFCSAIAGSSKSRPETPSLLPSIPSAEKTRPIAVKTRTSAEKARTSVERILPSAGENRLDPDKRQVLRRSQILRYMNLRRLGTINMATKEIFLKIVYYGPSFAGKTTNLQYIYNKTSPDSKGKMISLASTHDRTLFFDFLPIHLGSLKGFDLIANLYTVPGIGFYYANRHLILRDADGIIFVADSQEERLESNVESIEELKKELKDWRLDLEYTPYVLQFNKRDLFNALPVDELYSALSCKNEPAFESVCPEGRGVFDTLHSVVKQIATKIRTS